MMPLVSRSEYDRVAARTRDLEKDLRRSDDRIAGLEKRVQVVEAERVEALMKLSASETTAAHLRERIEDLQRHVECAEADKDRLLDLVETQELNMGTVQPAKAQPERDEPVSLTGAEVVRRAEAHRLRRRAGMAPVAVPQPAAGGQK